MAVAASKKCVEYSEVTQDSKFQCQQQFAVVIKWEGIEPEPGCHPESLYVITHTYVVHVTGPAIEEQNLAVIGRVLTGQIKGSLPGGKWTLSDIPIRNLIERNANRNSMYC